MAGIEVRVTDPAGNEVPVQMAGHARSRSPAEIQADVESLGVQQLPSRPVMRVIVRESSNWSAIAQLVEPGEVLPAGQSASVHCCRGIGSARSPSLLHGLDDQPHGDRLPAGTDWHKKRSGIGPLRRRSGAAGSSGLAVLSPMI